MAASFATNSDLADWMSVESYQELDPADIDRLLARASARVRSRIVQPIDSDNDTHVDALRDATCAVVEAWVEVGEANDIDGLAGTQISVTGYSGTRAWALCPRAEDALTVAGLGYRGVVSA